MSFGKRLLEARKKTALSQEDLARQLGTKGPAIGRYERDEMKPSIEVAAKMADILDVSLDYLVGKTDTQVDKTILNRILELSKFSDEDKNHIFAVMDAFIAKRKIQSIL
jgi:transcriptional regulator with XRE-family HTH domain